MRTLFVLICSVALASFALSAEQGKGKKKEEPKKQAGHAGQVSQPTGKGGGKPTAAGHPSGGGKPVTGRGSSGAGKPSGVGKAKVTGKATGVGKPATAGGPSRAAKPSGVGKAKIAGKPTGVGKPAVAGASAGKKFQAQHFNLPSKPSATTASTKFQENRRIQGSQNWQGSNYTVFRNYSSQWHDRNWWGSHYNRIVFVFGGWYYWDADYWYPAWGYDPGYSYYPYDGPIYGYHNLPPDQVIANVQAALQQQGYYRGEVDGLLGPLTRAAVADYQRDHGLYITSAIDRPTLSSLGLT